MFYHRNLEESIITWMFSFSEQWEIRLKILFPIFLNKYGNKYSISNLKRKTYFMTAWNKTKKREAFVLYFTFPTTTWPLPSINSRLMISFSQSQVFLTSLIYSTYQLYFWFFLTSPVQMQSSDICWWLGVLICSFLI